MAFASLATTADLEHRGINTEDLDADMVAAILASASAAVRDAAGGPIGATTTTVTVPGTRSEWLTFPMLITSVDSVTIDGTPVSGWKLRGGQLWRSHGWWPGHGNDITVAGTFGLGEVPADIVDLVCSLFAAALAATQDGYDPGRGLSAISIDDYRESYTRGDDEIVNPMHLPDRTRAWLRQRFGGGTYVTGVFS